MKPEQKPKDPYELDTDMSEEELAYWREKEPWNYIVPDEAESDEDE